MRYVVDEFQDGIQVRTLTVEHPSLQFRVPWYLNGELQGVTTVGPKGFLLTTDRKFCLVFQPIPTED